MQGAGNRVTQSQESDPGQGVIICPMWEILEFKPLSGGGRNITHTQLGGNATWWLNILHNLG